MKTIKSEILSKGIIIILVPIFLFSIVHIIIISKSLFDSAVEDQITTNEALRENFDSILNEIEHATNNLASNSLIQEIFKKPEIGENEIDRYILHTQLDSVFFNFFGSRQEIEYINILRNDFQYIVLTDRFDYTKIEGNNDYGNNTTDSISLDFSHFFSSEDQLLAWTDSIDNLQGVLHDNYIYLIRRVYSDQSIEGNNEIGMLIVGVNKAVLGQALVSFDSNLSVDTAAIYFSPDEYQSLFNENQMTTLIKKGNFPNNLEKVKEINSFTWPYSTTIHSSIVPEWKIVSIISVNTILTKLKPYLGILFISFIFCVVLAVYVAIKLSDQLTIPLRNLSEQTQLFSKNIENFENNTSKHSETKISTFPISFRQRITKYYIFITILPLLLFVIVNFTAFAVSHNKHVQQSHRNEITQMLNTLNLSHHSFENISERIWTNMDFQQALTNIHFQSEESEKTSIEIINAVLTAELLNQRYLHNISVYDESGKLLTSSSLTAKGLSEKLPATFELDWMEKNGQFSIHDNSGDSYLLMGNKLFCILQNNKKIGAHIGYITFALDISYFEYIMQRLDTTTWEQIVLAHNNNGILLYRKDKDRNFNQGDFILPFDEPISQIENDRKFTLLGKSDFNLVLIGEYTQPVSEGITTPMIIFTTSILIVIIIGSIIIIISISKRITQPLLQLSKSMSEMQAFSTSHNLDPYKKAPIEIQQMAYNFFEMTQRLQQSIKNMITAQEKKREAEIHQKEAQIISLQTQINPHFLYNTLDTVNWKALSQLGRNNEISTIVTSLAKILRESLSHSKTHLIPIRKQIELVEEYLSIQNIRYGDALCVEWNIDSQILDYATIPLLLQPIVENAINHGISKVETGGTVRISGSIFNNDIELKVEDTGPGINPEKLELLRNKIKNRQYNSELQSIGLYNTNQRIASIFGGKYGITLDSTPGCGTTITLVFPAIEYKNQIGKEDDEQ